MHIVTTTQSIMTVSMLFFFKGWGAFIFILIYNRWKQCYFCHAKRLCVEWGFSWNYDEFWNLLQKPKIGSFRPLVVSMLTCKSRIVPEINSCSLNHSFEFSAVDVKEKSKQLKWGHKQLLEEEPLPGYLSWRSAVLLSGRPWAQTPAGPHQGL